MIGHELTGHERSRSHVTDDAVLDRRKTGHRSVREVSFTLHRGEVIGLAGLVGSGRGEIGRALFGSPRFVRAASRKAAGPSARAIPATPARRHRPGAARPQARGTDDADERPGKCQPRHPRPPSYAGVVREAREPEAGAASQKRPGSARTVRISGQRPVRRQPAKDAARPLAVARSRSALS